MPLSQLSQVRNTARQHLELPADTPCKDNMYFHMCTLCNWFHALKSQEKSLWLVHSSRLWQLARKHPAQVIGACCEQHQHKPLLIYIFGYLVTEAASNEHGICCSMVQGHEPLSTPKAKRLLYVHAGWCKTLTSSRFPRC